MSRILVVDDEIFIRDILRRLLQRAGHHVEEACNGAEAVEKQDAHPFDLMITDIHMPEKEGLTTIMDLHRRYPDLKIIAMSGGKINDYLKWAKKLGAHQALSKPFDAGVMLRTVKELLESDNPPRLREDSPLSD